MNEKFKTTLIAAVLLGCLGTTSLALAHESVPIVPIRERLMVHAEHAQKQLNTSYSRYTAGQLTYLDVLEQENEKLLAGLRERRCPAMQKSYEGALHSNFRELLTGYQMLDKANRDVALTLQRTRALYQQVQAELLHRCG